ncbi:MAG: DEAD/DEAH box helicase family protein [Terracidiphilus sp.]
MSEFEVAEPILNSPFEEPRHYWYIREGETPEKREGRRPAFVFPPRDQTVSWTHDGYVLRPSRLYPAGYELALVNLIRERRDAWETAGFPGVSRTTFDLIQWWQREGREKPLFYAQLEAAKTIIFLREARQDFLQGIRIPADEPSDDRKAEGLTGFERYAAKMATGAGKTTVMGMVIAWSVLNKVNNRGDARFSDVALVVCPNVTIRSRLEELKPERGDASVYRSRDLVPAYLMPQLMQGKVLVTNWHVFEPQAMQTGGVSAKVEKRGKPVDVKAKIIIGKKTTTARGKRYVTLASFTAATADGAMRVISGTEKYAPNGGLAEVEIVEQKYIESDTALLQRVLGRDVGGKQNILILNDEAHHAYRIRKDEPDPDEEDEEGADEFFKEATVWVDGLDKVHKHRGINLCVDLSATPYFLGRVGQETNKPFPWVVSDFGLVDAIESGLVKIPQLAVRDTTGAEIPGYRNIWQWVMEPGRLTAAERGGSRANPKPDAVLKWAHTPISMLGGLWQTALDNWGKEGKERPPVFILVCKNTKLAQVIYAWLAKGEQSSEIPPARIAGLRNTEELVYTIRVDSKVVDESDSEGAKSDDVRWMRFTLDTVGKTDWPRDTQGRPIYPENFEELARKMKRGLHPPGRDVRCIVSVGMLTEGWDCNTVTHIIGLRPFMSQLLCEQVVGRGLRRSSYALVDGKFPEEVATVFGVPFEVIPYKANPAGAAQPKEKRHHIHALPDRQHLEIRFPRVEGYTQAIRNRINFDWDHVPQLVIDPLHIPPEVEMMGLSVDVEGKMSLSSPGKTWLADLKARRSRHRMQELIFDTASQLTRLYAGQPGCTVPTQALFPQLLRIVERYVSQHITAVPPAEVKDALLCSPYYGWLIETLKEHVRPDTNQGEAPEVPVYETHREDGSTADVDTWTSRDVRPVLRSHVNFVVADTQQWEQAAAYLIDTHPRVRTFVKNAGLGLGIPYLHNGQMHEYVPDFLIQFNDLPGVTLILETKGYDPLADTKKSAAERWAAAVNAEGKLNPERRHGQWRYAMVRKVGDIPSVLAAVR